MTQIWALQMPSWLARPSLLGPSPSTMRHTTDYGRPFAQRHRGPKQILPLFDSSPSTRQMVASEDALTREARLSG